VILAVLTTGDDVGGPAAAARARNRERLLVQIQNQQWEGRKILVVDGALRNPPPDWELLEVDKGANTDNAFPVRRLLEHVMGQAAPLLILEDDGDLADYALEAIRAFEIPEDVGAVCWFENIFRATARAGLYRIRARNWSGWGQAVTLPQQTIDRLVHFAHWRDSIGWDSNLSTCLDQTPIAWAVPALVQHREGPSIAHPDLPFPHSETFKASARGLLP
jgi:hypothetical protein